MGGFFVPYFISETKYIKNLYKYMEESYFTISDTPFTGVPTELKGKFPKVSSIKLADSPDSPYVQLLHGEIQDCNESLNALALTAEYDIQLQEKILEHSEDLRPLIELGFHGLDKLVKTPQPLTYKESFSLISYVIMASNEALKTRLEPIVPGYKDGLTKDNLLLLQSVSLLQAMSTREAMIGLTAEEIAGMIAATVELDTITRVKTEPDLPVFALGGMGGDRGIAMNGEYSKLFSVSTISAFVLGEYGLVHKHHSYPNTSKIAGQSAIESFGSRSDFKSSQSMEHILETSNILMTSCHTTRTLHHISHALKGETINHVIGPGAFPHSADVPLTAFIGVNQNVHPSTFIDALKILNTKGIQKYSNSVAFCGIDDELAHISSDILDPEKFYTSPALKKMVAMDEVPPPPYITMASFLIDGENKGTFFIEPSDFMSNEDVQHLSQANILIHNEKCEILRANTEVISGTDEFKVKYVAMTAALALFTRDFAQLPDALNLETKRVNPIYLKKCYRETLETVQLGKAKERMQLYVESTQKDCLPGIDVVIFDIDNTLAIPKNPAFYRQYGDAVNNAVAKYLNIPLERARNIADFYRQEFGGGEQTLSSYNNS